MEYLITGMGKEMKHKDLFMLFCPCNPLIHVIPSRFCFFFLFFFLTSLNLCGSAVT